MKNFFEIVSLIVLFSIILAMLFTLESADYGSG